MRGEGGGDLLPLSPPGRLAPARVALGGLGVRRREAPGAVPEDRPGRLGSPDHDGATFRLRVHVVAAGAPAVAECRVVRDRLRVAPALVAAHVAEERSSLAARVADGPSYAVATDPFRRRVADARVSAPGKRDGGGRQRPGEGYSTTSA